MLRIFRNLKQYKFLNFLTPCVHANSNKFISISSFKGFSKVNTNISMATEIRDLLGAIKSEDGKSIIESGMVFDIKYEGDKANIYLNLNKDYRKLKTLIEKHLQDNNIEKFEVLIAPQQKKSETILKEGLRGVKNIIAVYSCKGGVGKSTIAVNLAYSLAKQKKKVGIFDADIYGPSLPVLISPQNTEVLTYEDGAKLIIPIEFQGIKAMSFGFAAPNKKAVVRGPIVSNLVTQLVSNTDWGDLDYLIVDMPPGTGDIQISMCQELNFTGAVVVTTPQRLSFVDVVKGIDMLDELKIPVLSVVENMSYFVCDGCDKKHYIFGRGYVDMLKKQFGIENSYSLPMHQAISLFSDAGRPFVLTDEELSGQEVFEEISLGVIEKVDSLDKIKTEKPRIVFEPKEGYIFIHKGDKQIKKISPMELRRKCICAACVDEYTGHKILKDKNIPEDIHPTRIVDKGNYAAAIVWSDGHKSSIYPYKRLLSNDIGQD